MQDLVSWLLAHYGQEQMRPGLDRMRQALKSILPQFFQTKIIIIAGTNGKGETTLRLSNHLRNHPHFVWTSPHIERLTERFRSEEGEIKAEELAELIKSCHEVVQKEQLELSFYEFLFFVFCSWAKRRPPEFLLLEVGLGGRLDAVNVFDADLVLLPSISRDHQEILGTRYEEILREKLGTLRAKTLLIHFLESEYLSEKASEVAQELGAKVWKLKTDVSLPGFEFSRRNEVLAGAAYSTLLQKPFSFGDVNSPLTFLEHRGEVIQNEHEWILFGSHNVDGVRKLIQFLHSGTYNFSRPPYDLVIMAFSKRDLRDIRTMIRMAKKSGLGKIVITIFDHPKAMPEDVMEALSREEGSEFVQDIATYVQGQNTHQRLLVTGSYYFIGELQSRIRGRHPSAHSRR